MIYACAWEESNGCAHWVEINAPLPRYRDAIQMLVDALTMNSLRCKRDLLLKETAISFLLIKRLRSYDLEKAQINGLLRHCGRSRICKSQEEIMVMRRRRARHEAGMKARH